MKKEMTLIDRITRLESRLVVGFQALGVDVKQRRENVLVDHTTRVINVPNRGVSLSAVVERLPEYSGGAAYRVDIDGVPFCMIGAYDDTL